MRAASAAAQLVFEVGSTETWDFLCDKAAPDAGSRASGGIDQLTTAGKTLSRSPSRKNRFRWPTTQLLFGGRTLEQEIHLRSTSRNGIAGRETSIQQILFDIKAAIKEYVLQLDLEDTVIPSLVAQIDATIYVYRCKDGNRGVSPVLNGAQPVDGIKWNQQEVVPRS